MNRRPGVTLIEVLVAIFVAALGLLALLSLFPLGALSMAQAIRDDRVALTASNAAASLRLLDVDSDPNVLAALTQGDANFPPGSPTYAALFDPIGADTYVGAASTWVGGVPNGIRRCASATLQGYVGPNRVAFTHAWFTSLDDLAFTSDGPQPGVPADDQGRPAAVSGGPVQRDGRYSWAAVLRRPQWGQPVTEVSIVVYNGRTTNLNAGNFAPAGETPLPASVTAGNVVTVTTGPVAPDVRPGAWVVDTTPAPGHGYLYRVTGVTPNGNGTTDLELEMPLRATPTPLTQVVLLDYVTAVVEKGVMAP